MFRDLDGSTTGVIGGSVVHNTPYFNTYRCVPKPEWNAQICHENYGQLFIRNLDGTITNFAGTQGGMTFIRDEQPNYNHSLIGIPSGDPRLNYQPLMTIGKSVRGSRFIEKLTVCSTQFTLLIHLRQGSDSN